MIHHMQFAAALTARIAPGLAAAPGPVAIGIAGDAPEIVATR